MILYHFTIPDALMLQRADGHFDMAAWNRLADEGLTKVWPDGLKAAWALDTTSVDIGEPVVWLTADGDSGVAGSGCDTVSVRVTVKIPSGDRNLVPLPKHRAYMDFRYSCQCAGHDNRRVKPWCIYRGDVGLKHIVGVEPIIGKPWWCVERDDIARMMTRHQAGGAPLPSLL